MVRFSLACTLAPPLVRLRGRLSSPNPGAPSFPPSSQENRRACSLCFSFVTLFRPYSTFFVASLSHAWGVVHSFTTPPSHSFVSFDRTVSAGSKHNNTHSLLSIAEYLHFRRPQSPDHIITYHNHTIFKNSCLPRSLLDDQSASLKH